jgi:hypothetical protein
MLVTNLISCFLNCSPYTLGYLTIDNFEYHYEYINYSKRKKILMSWETNKHKCEECGISFESQQELQEHNNQVDSQNGLIFPNMVSKLFFPPPA